MMVHFGLAFALYCERRYDEAIEQAARAVDLYPDYGWCTLEWVWRYFSKWLAATIHCKFRSNFAAFTFFYFGNRLLSRCACALRQLELRRKTDGRGSWRDARN